MPHNTVHPVETQWHHPIFTEFGFVPDTKEAIGLVRNYLYVHPTTGRSIIATTGVMADYWDDLTSGDHGYHSTLRSHLKGLT